MSTCSPSPQRVSTARRAVRVAAAVAVAWLLPAAVAGCPSTLFYDEGAGQPTDRASGLAPAGSIGACKLKTAKRPPLVNAALWKDLKSCGSKTPRRYLRLGYGRAMSSADDGAEHRMSAIIEALSQAAAKKDGNARMLGVLREVRRQALEDPKLSARVERASGRTFACDYGYLLSTTRKQYAKQGGGCPAMAYDPKLKHEVCLFDMRSTETQWLTSAWSCLAFTGTLGEGQSCYRMCAYDDYCGAQVSCAAPDFDLVLCAMGICLPEKVAGLY